MAKTPTMNTQHMNTLYNQRYIRSLMLVYIVYTIFCIVCVGRRQNENVHDFVGNSRNQNIFTFTLFVLCRPHE